MSTVSEAAEDSKRSGAFRTIGEVSNELGVQPHVLRFWESKFSQINPHKRRGGHRYYRPSDVETLKEIKTLLHDKGFTIKGAQSFLSAKKKNAGVVEELFPKTEKAGASLNHEDLSALRHIHAELTELKNLLKQA